MKITTVLHPTPLPILNIFQVTGLCKVKYHTFATYLIKTNLKSWKKQYLGLYLILLLVTFTCRILDQIEHIDCYVKENMPRYRGKASRNKDGQCRFWKDIYDDSNLGGWDYSDRDIYSENYCRATNDKPWCYHAWPSIWDHCTQIPKCSSKISNLI